MPQFDKITFFNQIFWLLLTFSVFYFLVLKNLLPALASGLKTRKKLVTFLYSTASTGVESSSCKSYSKNLLKVLKTHKSLFFYLGQKQASLSDDSKTIILGSSFFTLKFLCGFWGL